MSPTLRSTGTNRSAAIDGLRAVTAMVVLTAHAVRSSAVDDHTIPWRVMDRLGYLAIATFFMLSGFFLYRPIASAHLAGRRAPSVSRYLVRRAVRVFPAYWAALVVALWVFGTNRPTDVGQVLRYFTLTQSYVRGGDLRGLFVAWTLVVEMGFYLTLPILSTALTRLTPARIDRSGRLRIQLGMLAAIAAAGTTFRFLVMASPATSWKLNWPPGFADFFAVGMLIGLAAAWVSDGGSLPAWITEPARTRWLCWGMVGGLIVVLTDINIDVAPTRAAIMVASAAYLVAGAFLIVPFTLVPPDGSRVLRTLGAPLGEYLGLLAYGVYLWHGVFLPPIDRAVSQGHFAGGFWPRFLVLLGASSLLGAVSWHLIEAPTLGALTRRERRRFRDLPAAAGSPVEASGA